MEAFALGLGPKIFAICREKVYIFLKIIIITHDKKMHSNIYC